MLDDCEHNHRRYYSKQFSGLCICEHNRQRRSCKVSASTTAKEEFQGPTKDGLAVRFRVGERAAALDAAVTTIAIPLTVDRAGSLVWW